MNKSKKHILSFARKDLLAHMEELNQPSYRADQIFKGIYAKNWQDFAQFSDLPKSFRDQLNRLFNLRTFSMLRRVQSEIDDTTKFLWQLDDGYKIESVIIYEGRRTTFCISSQVGCALDCRFCATGKMGFLRNLTSGEIVEQVLQMKDLSKRPPTNIVFMGMGEPMLNYDAVMQASTILADPGGLSFGRRRITISTSGIIPGILRMAEEKRPFSLAISLNAADANVRRKIMPITQKYPMNALMDAARQYTQTTGRRITFEYVLIDGVNASLQDARRLVELTRGIPCKINVIPCNSDDPLYKPPPPEVVQQFDRLVNGKNRTITVRLRKGWEIQAACGQLYAENERKTGSGRPLLEGGQAAKPVR